MNTVTIATIVLAVVAVLGVVGAVLREVYRRGGNEQHWTKALEDNTESNKELTIELRDFKTQTVEQLHGLDKRVTVLEKAGS